MKFLKALEPIDELTERATMTKDWPKEAFLKMIEISTNSVSIHTSYIGSGCFDYKLLAFTFRSSSATNIHTVCKLNVASIWCYFQIYRVFWLKICQKWMAVSLKKCIFDTLFLKSKYNCEAIAIYLQKVAENKRHLFENCKQIFENW